MSCRSLWVLSLATILATTSAAYAQQSGAAAEPSQPREAIAADAAPEAAQDSGDSLTDKAKNWAERSQIVERLNGDVDGWYPRLGGMTRGGGFALGPGYRRHLG